MRGRLVRDGYRGWYGWEDRYNAIIRMSFESMNNTNARNKQERFRHLRRQRQLEKQQQRHIERLEREMQEIKEELRSARAYCKVCQRYSYHSLKEQEGDRNNSEDVAINNSRKVPKGQRNSHNGVSKAFSGEGRERAEGLEKDKEPRCQKPAGEWQQGGGKALADGGLSTSEGDCYVVSNDTNDRERIACCVQIDAKGQLVAISAENTSRRQFSERKQSGSNANEIATDGVLDEDDTEPDRKRNSSKKVTFATETVISAKRERHHYDTNDKVDEGTRDRPRSLILAKWSGAISLITNNNNINTRSNTSTIRQRRQDGRARESKDNAQHSPDGATSRRRRPTAFPAQCRNTFSLRRFIQQEVEHLLTTFTPERARREKVSRILENSRFPDLVQRNRSTSAIFRNYQSYRRTSAYRKSNATAGQLKPAQVNEYSLKKLKERYEGLGKSRQVLLLPTLAAGGGVHAQRLTTEKDDRMAGKKGIGVLSEKKVVVLPRIEHAEYVS